jgi:hypothetical protein
MIIRFLRYENKYLQTEHLFAKKISLAKSRRNWRNMCSAYNLHGDLGGMVAEVGE